MLQQLNWMPLADYFVFKVLNDFTPNYIDIFIHVNIINTDQPDKAEVMLCTFKGKNNILTL